MPSLADRPFDLRLGDRVRFGVGAIGTLPDLIDEVGDADERQAFIVTDPGVVAAGVIDRVAAILGAVGARSVISSRMGSVMLRSS